MSGVPSHAATTTKTCLTGTDPSVAYDVGQILNVRYLVDNIYCYCYNFDGSKGKRHSDYLKCTKNVIKAQTLLGNLRTQCQGTVKKIYTHSTCGLNATQHFEPCIAKSLTTGKLTCAIKPTTKKDGATPTTACIDSPGKVTRVACPYYYNTCLDAADTNHDIMIGSGDRQPSLCGGVCVDEQTDFYNCGTCGNMCPYNGSCTSGTCACPTGDVTCDYGSYSQCADLQTDFYNCGTCLHMCPYGGSCTGGTCACPTGQTTCDYGSYSVCADLQADVNNCGACGNVCSTGQVCTAGTCACPAGTTSCGGGCVDEQTDLHNCGSCGNACPALDVCSSGSCVCGGTVCGADCVDANLDPSNCGSCGHACNPGDSCVGGTCVPHAVAGACLPTAMLSVLVQPPNVTAYVPRGSWSEPGTGVSVVQLEPSVGASTLVPTVSPVNSCSSNGATGTTICTGNSNDVYVINGTTLTSTLTAGATGTQFFSGGTCSTCGVAIDPTLGTGGAAAIMAGASAGGPGALQFLDITASTFGALNGLGDVTSEDVSIDPVRHLVLSANENGNFQIFNDATGKLFNNGPFGSYLDSTAEDCSTGIVVAPQEGSTTVTLWDLNQAAFTLGSPGTWTAPFNAQSFPDFYPLAAGTSGSAIAPGSHLALITGEFGGTAFGVIQLPFTSGSGTPAALDYVAANLPPTPDTQPWSMGLDPHTVSAYVSPSSGKAIGVISNVQRTYLALVDLQALLAAPRTAGTHTVDPSVDLVSSGIVTYVAQ